MAGNIVLVCDIHPPKQSWKIRCRIVRLWTTPGNNEHGEINSLEMVLQDEQGGRIHAYIKRSFVKKFIIIMKEGKVYDISQFSFKDNGGSYRTTKHSYRILFQWSTSVSERNEPMTIPRYGFDFCDFGEIIGKVADDKYLVDVIGKISDYHKLDDFNKDGSRHKRIVIYLEDLQKKKLSCTLWDDYAERISSYLEQHTDGVVVLIIQWCKVKDFPGNSGFRNISNSMYVTRLFIDSDVPESVDFKNRLTEVNAPVLNEGSSKGGVSLHDDFLNISLTKTLSEIKSSSEAGPCVTLCSVVSFATKQTWCYNACKRCLKKVEQDGEGFYCEKCDKIVHDTQMSYKVHLNVVDDEDGYATFVLFNNVVYNFLHVSAADLWEQVMREGDVTKFPVRLNAFLGRKFLFKVLKKKLVEGDSNKETSYTVVRMSADDDLISQFTNSNSSTAVTESSSQCPDLSESVKFTDDSEKDYDSLRCDTENEGSSLGALTPAKRVNEDAICFADSDETATVGLEAQMSSTKLKKFIKIEKD